MASEAEVQAAIAAYLNYEPAEGEQEVWGRVGAAMRAALEAAERVRNESRKESQV
jgi:hypothetical protein